MIFPIKKYRLLIAIPALLLLLSLLVIYGNFVNYGSFMQRDVELTGGLTITVKAMGRVDLGAVEKALPDATIRLAEGYDSRMLIIQTRELNDKKIIDTIRPLVNFSDDSVDVGKVEPVIGEIFWQQAQTALIMAFVFMGIVVLILFRSVVPSFTVIGCALVDIIMTVAGISLLDVRLSLPVFAGLLMLLGYSVDTDILLTTRVLKGTGTLREKIVSAIKTGLTMTSTSIAAVASLFIFSQGTIISQIAIVLLVGLCFDIMNTWITNVIVLDYWLEKREGGIK
jgi:preprotein translocase subunit SecF